MAKRIDAEIKIDIDFNTRKAIRDFKVIENASAQAGDRISKNFSKIDTSGIDKIEKKIKGIKDVKIDVDLTGDKAAKSKMDKISKKQTAKVEVDLDTNKAEGKIDQLKKKIGSIGDTEMGKWGAAAGGALGVVAAGAAALFTGAREDMQGDITTLQALKYQGQDDALQKANTEYSQYEVMAATTGQDLQQMLGLSIQAYRAGVGMDAQTAAMITGSAQVMGYDPAELFAAANSSKDEKGNKVSLSEGIGQAMYMKNEIGDPLNEALGLMMEYLPLLSQQDLGIGSQEFLRVLQAGKNGGSFSLDKTADAIKEATLKPDSRETFMGLIGKDTKNYTKEEKNFGSFQQMAEEALPYIINEKNATKKNELVEALFGSAGEDIGPEAAIAVLQELANGTSDSKATSKALENDFLAVGDIKANVGLGSAINKDQVIAARAKTGARTEIIEGINDSDLDNQRKNTLDSRTIEEQRLAAEELEATRQSTGITKENTEQLIELNKSMLLLYARLDDRGGLQTVVPQKVIDGSRGIIETLENYQKGADINTK